MTEQEYINLLKANRNELIDDVKKLREDWALLEEHIRYKIYSNPNSSEYKNILHEMDRIKGASGMKYKYMEKQVEGAKALAEKYPHMQTHQDIYQEHVEVLEKAKAFDRIKEMIDDQQAEGEPDSEVLSRIRYEVLKVEDENND